MRSKTSDRQAGLDGLVAIPCGSKVAFHVAKSGPQVAGGIHDALSDDGDVDDDPDEDGRETID